MNVRRLHAALAAVLLGVAGIAIADSVPRDTSHA
jgi:hypothetical protein